MSSTKKRSSAYGSTAKDPRFNPSKISPLVFDNFEAPIAIRAEDKAANFWARYNELEDPFVRFKRFWDRTTIDFEIHIRHVKTTYVKMVLEKKWTEAKFVAITNEIFDRGLNPNSFSYDQMAKLYEAGEIGGQRRRRSQERRRRR